MKNLFLFRLWSFSRVGFLLAILFMAGYAVTFSKKMDMTLFPYNAMFAMEQHQQDTFSIYRFRYDGHPVLISDFMYWKKDFLETSATVFGKYLQHGQKVYLQEYLDGKCPSLPACGLLKSRLLPGNSVCRDWPGWYIRFAGIKPQNGSRIDVVQYQAVYKNGELTLADSTVLLTNIYNR